MNLRSICFLSLLVSLAATSLYGAPGSGKISGTVLGPLGAPQMGATVIISAESLLASSSAELFTNDRGRFLSPNLVPGLYTVRTTLAGFLPSMQQHILVLEQKTTLLEIGLDSVFSSVDGLRRPQDSQEVLPDEWDWVLRTASSTRPILRWDDTVAEDNSKATGLDADASRTGEPRGRVELTSGARHPGSMANLAGSPGSAVVYDERYGTSGRLVLAGQFSYEGASPSGGFATEWLPQGDSGPVTNIVIRQSQFGPNGPTFRGVRLNHESQITLGDRVSVRYGGEYLMASLIGTTASFRPRGEVAVQMTPGWRASLIVATGSWENARQGGDELESTLDSLDGFPTLLRHDRRPIFEDDLHEEIALKRDLHHKAHIEAAVFHDVSKDTAVFGEGRAFGADYVHDFLSDAFAYDAGTQATWGARVAYREQLSSNSDVTVIYVRGGALGTGGVAGSGDLRDTLKVRDADSVAGRISTRIPLLRTRVTTGYKWISEALVSRQDPYGETYYEIDPYLSLAVRQPLPSFIPGHMEAVVDAGNLLAEGYVPMAMRDGQVFLVPTCRSFRGGLTFQF